MGRPPPANDDYGPPPDDEAMPPEYGCRLLRPPHRRRPSHFGKEDYLLACLLHDPDLVIALSARRSSAADPLACRIGNTWRIKRSSGRQSHIAGDDWDVEVSRGADELLDGRLGMLLADVHTAAYFYAGIPERVAQGIVADAPDQIQSDITRIKYLIDDAQRGDMEARRFMPPTTGTCA